MNTVFLIIYAVGVVIVCYALLKRKKDSLTEQEEVAALFAKAITNAVFLMTKEQYADQLRIWEKAYGKDTRMGDALSKEAFDMAECFVKEAKLRRA